MRLSIATLVVAVLASAASAVAQQGRNQRRLDAVRGVVAAVNARDADAYVADFAEDVVVRLYEGEVRLRGRQALRENRRRHLERHPHVRNELLHLVAIEDRVVLHDRVWLDRRSSAPADVVELYTFDAQDKIVLVDVLQPRDILTRGARPQQP